MIFNHDEPYFHLDDDRGLHSQWGLYFNTDLLTHSLPVSVDSDHIQMAGLKQMTSVSPIGRKKVLDNQPKLGLILASVSRNACIIWAGMGRESTTWLPRIA